MHLLNHFQVKYNHIARMATSELLYELQHGQKGHVIITSFTLSTVNHIVLLLVIHEERVNHLFLSYFPLYFYNSPGDPWYT